MYPHSSCVNILQISICSKTQPGTTSSSGNPCSQPRTEITALLLSSGALCCPPTQRLSHSIDIVCSLACPIPMVKTLEDRDHVQHPSTWNLQKLCIPVRYSTLRGPTSLCPSPQGRPNPIHLWGFPLGISTPGPFCGPGKACSNPEDGRSPEYRVWVT